MTRQGWVWKVIHWKLCKKLKLDHKNKIYMHNLKLSRKNETHKILWNVEIQTDYRIPPRRPDLVIFNNKMRTCQILDFAIPAHNRVKIKESENKDKYLDLVKELKKTMEHESDGDTNCKWYARGNLRRIGKETGGLWNKRTSGHHPDYSIIKIGQNIEKNPCCHLNSTEKQSSNAGVKNS